MTTLATILLSAYAAFYVTMMLVWFFNHKPLMRTIKYSTLILILLIAFLVVAMWVEGELFTGSVKTYF
jgi:hypothetical protein